MGSLYRQRQQALPGCSAISVNATVTSSGNPADIIDFVLTHGSPSPFGIALDRPILPHSRQQVGDHHPPLQQHQGQPPTADCDIQMRRPSSHGGADSRLGHGFLREPEGYCDGAFLVMNALPITSVSILVRAYVATASSGVLTIGSFSLREVLSRTGVPVNSPNTSISRW